MILESPWDHYRQVFELSLGGFVIVVSEKATPSDFFTIKHIHGVDEVLMLLSLSYRNLHQMLECFQLQGLLLCYFWLWSRLSCTYCILHPFSHRGSACSYSGTGQSALLASVWLPFADQQILVGLTYLAANDLDAGPYKCSSILLDADETVK